MKIFQILIPVYNDWESLEVLLIKINNYIRTIGHQINILIVDNHSSEKNNKHFNFNNISEIKIIENEKNIGHVKSIAKGINYLKNFKKFDFLIVMDSDGEDRPEEIAELIQTQLNYPNYTITANRTKRSESFFFRFFYKCHKILLFLFTGKSIKFGHYVSIPYAQVNLIFDKKDLLVSFSGAIEKLIFKKKSINSFRGIRYKGFGKMNFIKLIIHSLRIISVFKINFFLHSIFFFIFLSSFFFFYFNIFYLFVFLSSFFLLLILNLIIFYIYYYYSKP